MTNYNFSDSSMDERLDEAGEDLAPPRWSVHMNLGVDHPKLTNEQLKKLHIIFTTALDDAAEILEIDD